MDSSEYECSTGFKLAKNALRQANIGGGIASLATSTSSAQAKDHICRDNGATP